MVAEAELACPRFRWLVQGRLVLREDPSLGAAAAIARVRDEYVPEYARLRFPEHPSQQAALEAFARAR